MSEIEQRLAEMRGRSEKAISGPWVRTITQDRKWNEVRSPSNDIEQAGDERPVARSFDDDSAEFIAHARTDLDDLRGAVEDVLALLDEACVRGPGSIRAYFADDIRAAITARLGGA
jgi:hypothetical protein